MPEFAWRAADADGRMVEGVATAGSLAQVVTQLRAQRLTPLSVGAPGGGGADVYRQAATAKPPRRHGQGRAAGPADIFVLTSELAIMLRAGLPLDTALRLLTDMAPRPAVRQLVDQLLNDVKNGAPFSKALAAHPHHFGDFYINMVRSGEAGGQLAGVLERLVEHLERMRALRDSVVSASIYPLILLTVAVLSLIAMLGFVVPQFETLFKDMGDALPLPTQWVMAVGDLFSQHGWLLLLGASLLGVVLRQWLRSPSGQRWTDATVLRMPVLGAIARKYQLTLFARTLGTLLGNGVSLLSAMQISTSTVGNGLLRSSLEPMPAKVKAGGKLAEAFVSTGVFDPLAVNLVRVGEETGRIGPMLLELAQIYNRDVENGIKRGLTLLEPLLILVLGGLIAAIIVSILLGILSVNDLAL